MNRKINAAALGFSILAGGVVGVGLGTPSLAGAQDTVETPAESAPAPNSIEIDGADADADDAADADSRGEGRSHGRKGNRLAVAADLLGTDAEDLRAQVEAGADVSDLLDEAGVTDEQVAEAREVASEARQAERADRLAAAVASGEITQEEADEKLANCGDRGERGERGERGADTDTAEVTTETAFSA